MAAHPSKTQKSHYRLTGKSEPTDEMLSALMSAATADVRERANTAYSLYFKELRKTVKLQQQRWEKTLLRKCK